MCCNGSENSCNCGCDTLTLEQIAGPTGPQGPAGTTIIYWSGILTSSTATTGSDVLLFSTNTSVANSLTTNGSEYEIEITGTYSNNSDRAVKIDLNVSSLTTVSSNTGVLVDGKFKINCLITRASATTTVGNNQSVWNTGSTQQYLGSTNTFTTDFSLAQNIRIYVNQSVASSILIESIKIRRSIL